MSTSPTFLTVALKSVELACVVSESGPSAAADGPFLRGVGRMLLVFGILFVTVVVLMVLFKSSPPAQMW
jgi:hypothetical protein